MSLMSGLSVLYADYSPKAASLVREALQPYNIGAFYACETQEETLALAHRYRPRLVMVSHQLEGYQGIKTIGYLRAMSGQDDPYFTQVPVLLGAKSLNRDAMRSAVVAGIEGVFRQPVNPDRLHRIINTVIKSPRRFVLEGDYFGPSRKKNAPPETAPADTPTPSATPDITALQAAPAEDETRQSASDLPTRKPRQSNAGVVLRPTRKSASVDRVPAGRQRGAASGTTLPGTVLKGRKTTLTALSEEDLITPADARAKATLLDVADLQQNNRDATKSVSNLISTPDKDSKAPSPKPDQAAVPGDEADSDNDDNNDDSADDDLVEIDIRTALLTHKMWVDTGGKEGKMISFAHADLRNEDLEGIDLTRCVLPQASLHNANCEGAVLRRCDLTQANFSGANLKNAVLAASRLNGANFKDARLTGTVFLGADLGNANLRGAKLPHCDLSGCNLAKTDLRDADLSSAKGLFSEQIQRARINASTRLPRDMKLKTV
ncbi:pentapeptide repeat-containing protein [Thalassospira sp.]|uniref:pentapeptide repeat-containing protein n=1 Tax=Thalassospira sp. TaxID=1912094 RepID=UPI003AA97952